MTESTSTDSTSTLSWLRQRKVGAQRNLKFQPNVELMQRLQKEASLEGHLSCINCLEWNHNGSLLASGSDDRKVIVWDPFERAKRSIVFTGHEGNIFSVKFMPGFCDTLVASGASDCSVKLTDTMNSRNLLDCKECHSNRVKRLAVHQDEPHLIWSSGEDGLILQYDVREAHVCREIKARNLLIDLKNLNWSLKAKCIAINPINSAMLAVGATDVYNRIYDRRYLKSSSKDLLSTVYFAPGHLLRSNNRSNHLQSYGTSYLSFSPDGTELLASVHAEQVYLFDLAKPWERYKTFECSLSPILLNKCSHSVNEHPDKKHPDLLTRSGVENERYRAKPVHWLELLNYGEALREELPQTAKSILKTVFDDELCTIDGKMLRILLDHTNELLAKAKTCPELYWAKSKLLLSRGWRGDHYQAMRDCCCALALDPLNDIFLKCLSEIMMKLGHAYPIDDLMNFIELMLEHDEQSATSPYLREAYTLLKNSKENSPQIKTNCDDNRECDIPMQSDLYQQRDITDLLSSPKASTFTDLQNVLRSRTRKLSETLLSQSAYDYSQRFCGHCNMNTDIKEANFFGHRGDFIVGGSDDGACYIWNKKTGNIVKAIDADYHILNCVQPHPSICMLATSGIESSVKLWSPSGTVNHDVGELETRCMQNQKYISSDPLEAMILMLYPDLN